MLRSELFGNVSGQQVPGHFAQQNSKMLRVHLNGEVMARQGAMVAFQGQVDFNYEGSGGVGKFLKKAVTGEGVPLMRCGGQGVVYFANDADDVHLFYLENDALTVNGRNILAFDRQIQWDIQRVQGAGLMTGGLFNTTLKGTGWVAITAHGAPVMLDAGSAPTFADAQSAVAWSAGLHTGINKTLKAGALIGRGSGEAIQLAFQGQGFVLIQASEGPTVPPHSHGS
jgi:uncharacterized protein (AIM24 family)